MSFFSIFVSLCFTMVSTCKCTHALDTIPLYSDVSTKSLDSVLRDVTVISDVIDFDEDGINDLVVKSTPKQLDNGDTIYLEIYKVDVNENLSKKYIYKNVFPIWYKRYDLEYIVTLPETLQKKYPYSGVYPMHGIKVYDNKIFFTIGDAVGEGYDLVYEYDKSIDDWRLIKLDFWIKDYYGNKSLEPQLFDKEVLSDFKYSTYLW